MKRVLLFFSLMLIIGTSNTYSQMPVKDKGKCMYSHRRLPGAHERLTIGQLTEKIFASERAYMSLMLN